MPEEKKKVVYLIGTGASHAEIKYRDLANPGLLMPDVAKAVFSELIDQNESDLSIKELLNILDSGEPSPYNIDIESVITLYESTGTAIDKIRANKLKKYFRKIITDRISKIDSLEGHPKLLTALVDMHTIPDFDEELQAIITINYDDFIEKALINVYGGINFPFEIDKSYELNINPTFPPLCKLHGSFCWDNTNPVKTHIMQPEDNEDRCLWVPPGVVKRNDYYPFNAIWGTARKSLKCDILRIIGCSLSKNDWGLITLLHTTNRLRNDISEKYEIEYIDYPDSCDRVLNDFPFFEKLKTITDLTEFELYMKKEHGDKYNTMKGEKEKERMNNWLNDNKKGVNIFAEWLTAKAYYRKLERKLPISTDKGYFQSFFLG
jgi:hypothetical protein